MPMQGKVPPPPAPERLETVQDVIGALKALLDVWTASTPPLPPRPPASDPAWRERIVEIVRRAGDEMADPAGESAEEIVAAWRSLQAALADAAGDQYTRILLSARGFSARLRFALGSAAEVVARPRPAPLLPDEVAEMERRMAQVMLCHLPLPWPALARAGVAIVPGTLEVVAAATSHGKSIFLLNLVLHWLMSDPDGIVIHHSSEMTKEMIYARAMAMLSASAPAPLHPDKNYKDRSVKDILELYSRHASNLLALELPFDLYWARKELFGDHGEPGLASRWYLSTGGRYTARDLVTDTCDMINRAKRIGKRVLAVVVDYVQDLPPVGEDDSDYVKYSRSREQEIAKSVRTLAEIAEDLDVPVVAAAQLNRNVRYDSHKSYVPANEYIYGSGENERKASTVMGLRNITLVHDPFGALRPNDTVQLVKVVGDHGRYRDTYPQQDLQLATLAALMSVREALAATDTPHAQATLLELYVMKNRLFGSPDWVVPMMLFPRSGVIRPLAHVWIPEHMLPDDDTVCKHVVDRREMQVSELLAAAGIRNNEKKNRNNGHGRKNDSPKGMDRDGYDESVVDTSEDVPFDQEDRF